MPYAISNSEFGLEQDFKVIQCTKSDLGQNWVNKFQISNLKKVNSIYTVFITVYTVSEGFFIIKNQ